MYLKSVNYKEIYFKIAVFIVYFLILIFVFFISIYFFYRSFNQQKKRVENDLIAYKSLLNKQYLLKSKVDTIYYYMRLLYSGKVEHDSYLEEYITKDLVEIKKLLKEENEENFIGYTALLPQLDSLLLLKHEIIVVGNQEAVTLRDLNACMHRFKNVYTELTDDPSRKFTKK
ncbi:type VI secretion system TssO [Myroides sp. DW712]|uniref:type VI secretion system TssO n=1 Tax=Myroides sp. DW712 TaxID=3389800 RepID=UPI0039784187